MNLSWGFARWAAMGVVLFTGLQAFAQSDPYDPSSPNYVGNSTVKKPKWNASLSATAFRGQDELAEEGAYYEGVVGYYLSSKLRGDVTVGYSHPLDLDADRPDRWALEDVRLRLLSPSVWKSDSRAQNLGAILSLDLPTSGTSRDATQLFRLRFSGQYTYRWGRFTASLVPSVNAAWHEFETSDVDGFVKNSPLGLSVNAALRYGVTRKLGFVGSIGYLNAFNYDFDSINVQSVSASAQYALTSKSFAALTYFWRDRVLTNNALFDDDASRTLLSLGYMF